MAKKNESFRFRVRFSFERDQPGTASLHHRLEDAEDGFTRQSRVIAPDGSSPAVWIEERTADGPWKAL